MSITNREKLRLEAVRDGLIKQFPETYVRVDLTAPCFKVIERYAQMRGMTPSQVMFLSVRYSLYKEALDRPEVRRLFREEGIDFDSSAVAEWQSYIDSHATLDEIFSPLPEEAFEGGKSTGFVAMNMIARFLFNQPESLGDACWRLVSTVLITSVLTTGYVLAFRPEIIHLLIAPTSRSDWNHNEKRIAPTQ